MIKKFWWSWPQNRKKQITGIVGSSGSNLFIKYDIGFIDSKKGNIYYVINNIKEKHLNYSNLFSYVPQDIFLLDDTVLSNIVFGQKVNRL